MTDQEREAALREYADESQWYVSRDRHGNENLYQIKNHLAVGHHAYQTAKAALEGKDGE